MEMPPGKGPGQAKWNTWPGEGPVLLSKHPSITRPAASSCHAQRGNRPIRNRASDRSENPLVLRPGSETAPLRPRLSRSLCSWRCPGGWRLSRSGTGRSALLGGHAARTAARRCRAGASGGTVGRGRVAVAVVAGGAVRAMPITVDFARAAVVSRRERKRRRSHPALDRYPGLYRRAFAVLVGLSDGIGHVGRGGALCPADVESDVAGFRSGRRKRQAGGADHQRGDAEIGDGGKEDETARRQRARPPPEQWKLDHDEDVSS